MARRRLLGSLTRLLNEPWVTYPVFLCVFGFVLLIRWPIVAGDSDLWYHLNGGRYIVQHGAIPRTSYFSFIEPPRPWVDYYWLFQVLVYEIYARSYYYGLIVLRAVAYLATTLAALRFLLEGQRTRPALAWCAFLGGCCAMILLPRNMLVRPHLFTYFFILCFLYVLELRPRLSWWLLPLGLLWSNLHGGSYPLMLAILGAYGAEELLVRLRTNKGRTRAERLPLLPCLLTAATILATPHGLRLLPVPFTSTAGASRYIKEFEPLHLWDVFSLHFSMMTPTSQTVFNIFLLLSCVTAVTMVTRRTWRIRHVLLFAVGWVLLLKGIRFMNEFALLALPLLRANPLLSSTRMTKRVPKAVYLVAVGLVLLLPLRVLLSTFSEKPKYPISSMNLPTGVVAFLNHVDVGGKVLNHPNNGGYLQWMLYPRYKIFMDMEIPFLFSDEEMYLVQHAFMDEKTMEIFLSRYRPDFLLVPTEYEQFSERIQKHPNYVPVFFDDFEVLYADRRQHPALVDAYALAAVKPFELVKKNADEVLKDAPDREALLRELRRILAVYPECGIANHLVAVAENETGAYAQALPHIEAIIATYPESPNGYRLKADALKGLKRYREAIAFYNTAIDYAEPPRRAKLYKEMGLAHLELKEYDRAYRLLKDSIEVFSPLTKREDLYSLGIAALRSGKQAEAGTILQYLSDYQVAGDDAEWKAKLDAARAELETTTKGAR